MTTAKLLRTRVIDACKGAIQEVYDFRAKAREDLIASFMKTPPKSFWGKSKQARTRAEAEEVVKDMESNRNVSISEGLGVYYLLLPLKVGKDRIEAYKNLIALCEAASDQEYITIGLDDFEMLKDAWVKL